MIIGAGQTQGYRRTALHPLGSLDDHAYVLTDAEVTALIIDPNPMFIERALGLLEKVPSLKQILTIGPVPEALAERRRRSTSPPRRPSTRRSRWSPRTCRPTTSAALAYTGGTTGKPKGVMGTSQSITTMTTIQLAEWEWPEHPRFLMCTPLSHAGRGVLHAHHRQGRRDDRADEVRSGRGAAGDRGAEDHRDDAGAVDDLRADGPSRFAHPRPVVAGDRLLRRLGDEPGAAGGGDQPVRADLRAVLRAVRGADGDHLPGEGRSRREAADVVRQADAVRPDRAARRRRTTRCRRARSARSACPGRCCPAATGTCRRPPRRRSATAGCTPATWPARTRTASGTSSTGPRT